jgi:hypothetical protein
MAREILNKDGSPMREYHSEIIRELLNEQPMEKKLINENGICPVTKLHCDDECCPIGATCNMQFNDCKDEEAGVPFVEAPIPPAQKAKFLMFDVNNMPFSDDEWYYKASEFAKRELKRKAYLIVDEILDNFGAGNTFYTAHSTIEYYKQVRREIEKI